MSKRNALALAAALAVLVASRAGGAANWQSLAGVQSFDEAIQAEAFLPNELWVHAGDSITWTFPAGEIHTVTFLKPGQVRPSNGAGCPGTTPDQSNFDGSACVHSGSLLDGRTYTVKFPTAGNFKVVCLVHDDMTGAVHVLGPSEALPYQQAFYDDQAKTQRDGLLKDGAIQLGLLKARAQQNPGLQSERGQRRDRWYGRRYQYRVGLSLYTGVDCREGRRHPRVDECGPENRPHRHVRDQAFGSAPTSFGWRGARFGRGEACRIGFTRQQRALGISSCGFPGQNRTRAIGSGRDAVSGYFHDSGYLRLHLLDS